MFDLCTSRVQEVYSVNWTELKVLPVTLEKHCLKTFRDNVEDMKISPNQLKRCEELLDNEWEYLKPFTANKLHALLLFPSNVCYPCIPELCHVILEYYYWYPRYDGIPKKICEICFSVISKFYKPYSQNYWNHKYWFFDKIKNHDTCFAENFKEEFVENKEYWCENCHVEPFIVNVIDKYDCKYEYGFHTARRRLSFDNEQEEYIQYLDVSHVIGNYVQDYVFQDLLNNNML